MVSAVYWLAALRPEIAVPTATKVTIAAAVRRWACRSSRYSTMAVNSQQVAATRLLTKPRRNSVAEARMLSAVRGRVAWFDHSAGTVDQVDRACHCHDQVQQSRG